MKKILICEDHLAMANVTSTIIKTFGFEPVVFNSFEDANKSLTTIMPDMILMDLRLPRISGDEAVLMIKSNTLTKNIPILVCSVDMNHIEKALKNGADDYILKPFEIKDLELKIRKYFNKN